MSKTLQAAVLQTQVAAILAASGSTPQAAGEIVAAGEKVDATTG